MDAFAVARFGIGAGFLAVAAYFDVRTRRVHDPVWIALGTIGLALLVVELSSDGVAPGLYAVAGATAILFYALFYGAPILDEDGVHLRPLRLSLLALAALLVAVSAWLAAGSGGTDASGYVRLLTMPAMVLVYQGFYQVGLLRGGADTKAMIALTLLVPLYPDASPYPLVQAPAAVQQAMEIFFPFSLVILVDAAILILAIPLAYLALNLVRGEFEWPVGFLGAKASIDALPRHAWVMERVDAHGERYAVLFPSRKADESDQIAKLRSSGATRVWVETKIPFVLLLFFGFLLAFFLGNVLLGVLTAVLPPP